MEKYIEFFKREAKKMHKDSKNENPKYYKNIKRIIAFFKKEKPSLMQIQHIIAKIAGANKWTELTQENIQLFKKNLKNFEKGGN